MSYPLQQTHSVLQQCLQSNDLFAVNAKGKNDCLAPAWEEIQNFRPLFLRSAASAPSAEALRILVEVTATGCTDAMNIVSLLQQQNERRDSPPALSRLELSLGEILSWLRTRFNSYINEDMALPRSLAAKELMDIRHVLSELCAKAEVSVCREGLALISNLVKEIFERNDALPSYRLVAYLRNLINGIRELSTSSPVDTAALDSWAKLFIRYNCNDALFIHHIIQKLSGEANDILLLPGRAEKWQWFRKEINQVLECGTALHPDAPSVKAYLLSAIGSELTWLGKEKKAPYHRCMAAEYRQPPIPRHLSRFSLPYR